MHTRRLSLDKNGNIIYDTQLPQCDNGGRIKLLSYKFLQCPPGEPCNVESYEELSLESEVIIHKICSMKQSCVRASFPPTDLLNLDTPVVEVTFRCLGKSETFIDICDNKTHVEYKRHIHFIHETAAFPASHERCVCILNGRDFGSTLSVTLEDVRLISPLSNNCSSARLRISNQIWGCNAADDGYGSVFRQTVGEDLPDALLIVTKHAKNMEPEMIFLTVEPKDTVRVICGHGMSALSTTFSQTQLERERTAMKPSTSKHNSEEQHIATARPLVSQETMTVQQITQHENDNVSAEVLSFKAEDETFPFSTNTIIVGSVVLFMGVLIIILGIVLYHRMKPTPSNVTTREADDETGPNSKGEGTELLQPTLISNKPGLPDTLPRHYDQPVFKENDRIVSVDSSLPGVCYSVAESDLSFGSEMSQSTKSAEPANHPPAFLPTVTPAIYQELNNILNTQQSHYASMKKEKQ